MREQEPPDSWDSEFPDGPLSSQIAVNKPWKGAATFIPKVVQVPSKKHSTESKQVSLNMSRMDSTCTINDSFKFYTYSSPKMLFANDYVTL